MAQGFRNIRVQVPAPGFASYGSGDASARVEGLHEGPVFEPAVQFRYSLKLIEEARKQLGEEVGLLHDMHERTRQISRCSLPRRWNRIGYSLSRIR